MEFDRAGAHVMNESLTPLLQFLCELDPPEVSRQWIDRHEFKESIEALISKGALVQVANADVIVCKACDRQHWVMPESTGTGCCRGYCPINGFYHFSAKQLQRFAVDNAWIASTIGSTLALRPKGVDGSPPILSIGRTKFGPYSCEVFFGSRLYDRARFETAMAVIKERAGAGPAILLTSTRTTLLPGKWPERCAIIVAENVLLISPDKILLNEVPILAALRGPVPLHGGGGIGFRFSPGFRSCLYGHQTFQFSATQALVVEALYCAREQGLPSLHQNELRGQAETNQRMVQLFYRHPAYGTLIRHDGSGYYRLDC